MSRIVRKIQKKISESKSSSPKSELPATQSSEIGQALEKFFNAEKERSRLMRDLDLGVMEAVENLIECIKHAYGGQKSLEQTLQETRRKYQAAMDDLSVAQEELRELQAAKTKLEQDKIKIEQKLQWTKVELQMTKDELKRVEEKAALEAELDHWEDEISRCKRRIGRGSNSHEVYESQLKVAQEARDRCLERLGQLQEASTSGNFKVDFSLGLLSEESNAILWEYVNEREPTDEVVLYTEEDVMRLLKIWGTGDTSFISTRTVPLKDFVITLVADGFAARVIFDSDDSAGVLIVETELAGLPKKIKLALFIRSINSVLSLSADLGYNNLSATEKNFLERHLNASFGNVFLESGYKVLSLWCAIEQALLNPPIREYIAGRHLEAGVGQEVYSHGKNVVTYIKRIPITVDDLLPNIEQKNFEWHVDKWGVVGHWREYPNGKKVWVRPYEKGRKRNQKIKNQELRERIIETSVYGQVPAQ